MKSIITIALALLVNMTEAQESSFYNVRDDITYRPIVHASIIIMMGDKSLYVDPWGDTALYNGLGKADIILITDIHQDHFSLANIEHLMTDKTALVAPEAVYNLMSPKMKKNCKVLKNGESHTIPDTELEITAIPMYNLPESAEAYHVKGRGNGYLMSRKGIRIYVSGDTGDIPEMRALKSIDFAFICMNMPYTMTIESAASAVIAFRPRIVVPYHYRNADKSLSDVRKFCELVGKGGLLCQLRNWYPN